MQDTGKDPISGADASIDDLVAVKNNQVSSGVLSQTPVLQPNSLY